MRILIIAAVLLCSACASPSVLVRKNITLHRLGIFLEPGDHAAPFIVQQFKNRLDDFIVKHNAAPANRLELFHASATDSSTLRIKLVGSRMVTPGQQTAGVMVSLLGLSIPFIMIGANAPIIVFFYYFPDVRSLTELSVSEDIRNESMPKREFILSSPGFLKSPERQLEKHAASFESMLSLLVRQITQQTTLRKANSYADMN